MRLKYKNQRFQIDAARCITDIFKGQRYQSPANYIIDRGRQKQKEAFELSGFANPPIQLEKESLADNVQEVQRSMGIQPVGYLEGSNAEQPTFTVEMETGTGKTYTYIKTMYELNKLYGWSKFVIVVPSVAIREGVYKSFDSMKQHFLEEYGKPIQYFIYNSKQLSKIDSFASDAGMHVMIINMGAFNRSFDSEKKNNDSLVIFSRRDEFGSRKPIDVLAKTNPIMIIDEPQTVLGANKNNVTRQNLKVFNPLFTLLYSATHRKGDDPNMVFRLDAMDAYNMKLVKKIVVKGVEQIGSTATSGYIYLEDIILSKGNPRARISFDVKTATGTKRTSRLVEEGFDLYQQSGELDEYRNNFIVEKIDGKNGTITLLNGVELTVGQLTGDVSEEGLRRTQIYETIKSHIERERNLFKLGIKVLSLFFIDHVESYRVYETGGHSNGKFAEMFEEEYRRVLSEMLPTFTDNDYISYLKRFTPAQVHQGYFSKDKKGNFINSKANKEGSSDDESAYDLIMKDKERLLSFEEPVRFIFSHSALKEGWDNPNVFQICTLKDTSNELKKHQEVGRGMRLCVNKYGERQDIDVLGDDVFNVNTLTVIASESYEKFAKALQTEMAERVTDRPLKVTSILFEKMLIPTGDGGKKFISSEQALEIYEGLISEGYVKKGALTDKFFDDKKSGAFSLGEELDGIKEEIIKRLDLVFNPNAFKPENARNAKIAKFRDDLFKEKFQEVWNRINLKTYYRVSFDSEELIQKAIITLDRKLSVTELRFVVKGGELKAIESKAALQDGSAMTQGKARTIKIREAVGDSVKYDLVGKLVEATGLTRRTIASILKGIRQSTFNQAKTNPEEFIIKAANIINDEKAIAVVEKITYEASKDRYTQDVFTASMLRGKLGENAIESEKSLYDLVVVDSMGVEKTFAEELEHHEEVEVYTKLPRGFYINTPMGKYNPDWAVTFREECGVKHIYFIAETKGNEWQRSSLRGVEDCKLECAARHFETISGSDVKYGVAKDYKTLYDKVMK